MKETQLEQSPCSGRRERGQRCSRWTHFSFTITYPLMVVFTPTSQVRAKEAKLSCSR